MNSKIAFLIVLIIAVSGCSQSEINGFVDLANEELNEIENTANEIIKKNTPANPSEEDNNSKPPVIVNNDGVLLIANWNLQIFGQSKALNKELMQYYVNNIDDYDIIVIQEIRDKAETAFPKLCSMLPEYDCIVSTRAGTTSSKEQYGIIFKGVELVDTVEYNVEPNLDDFERPPFEATFKSGDWIFTLVTIHTKPDDVARELENLEKLLEERTTEEIIILGDLNASCSYYKEKKHFLDWFWVIADGEDTTVAKSDCTYDRIIFNELVEDNFIEYGVMNEVLKEQSDHYLVWGKFAS